MSVVVSFALVHSPSPQTRKPKASMYSSHAEPPAFLVIAMRLRFVLLKLCHVQFDAAVILVEKNPLALWNIEVQRTSMTQNASA